MQLTIKSRNIVITDAIRDYAEKRLSKLGKLLSAEEATVTISSVKDFHRVKVNIPYSNVLIRGEEEGYDLYACIDLVVDKLERQIHKYRTRLIQRNRYNKDAVIPSDVQAADESMERPVRVKSFTTRPMSVEEAIMQMNLLSHSFFAFYNSETSEVNVVYCRKDGTHGLLEPDK